METSHLIWCAKQMTGFHMKYKTALKYVNGDRIWVKVFKNGPSKICEGSL